MPKDIWVWNSPSGSYHMFYEMPWCSRHSGTWRCGSSESVICEDDTLRMMGIEPPPYGECAKYTIETNRVPAAKSDVFTLNGERGSSWDEIYSSDFRPIEKLDPASPTTLPILKAFHKAYQQMNEPKYECNSLGRKCDIADKAKAVDTICNWIKSELSGRASASVTLTLTRCDDGAALVLCDVVSSDTEPKSPMPTEKFPGIQSKNAMGPS